MISLRRADGRSYSEGDQRRVWSTLFQNDQTDLPGDNFGALEFLCESRLGPGASIAPHSGHEGEVISYVHEGVLSCSISKGWSGQTRAGEFQRMSVGREIRYREKNSSRTGSAHIFQIGLRSSETRQERAPEQKRFTAAQRHNTLCFVASSDGRMGSLRIHQDTLIISSLLDEGHHFIHELSPGRKAWLHLVHGQGTLGGVEMTTGDGAGVTEERAVSFTAQEETEILLVDVGEDLARPLEDRAVS